MLASCGGRKHSRAKTPAPPRAARVGSSEKGIASWYGDPYHGRRAANGEIYDMEKLTAAHRTLPFETWVRVKNLTNHKTVEVRITDRGPFIDGRIIDLSRAAARDIDLIRPGIVKVRLEVIRPPKHMAERVTARVAERQLEPAPPRPPVSAPEPQPEAPPEPTAAPAAFAVQIGAFQNRDRAADLRRDMELRYGAAVIVEMHGSATLYRVLAGRCASETQAEELARALSSDFKGAFVVRLED
jgi:rare lipoprotein A